jgi:hypothetical protein
MRQPTDAQQPVPHNFLSLTHTSRSRSLRTKEEESSRARRVKATTRLPVRDTGLSALEGGAGWSERATRDKHRRACNAQSERGTHRHAHAQTERHTAGSAGTSMLPLTVCLTRYPVSRSARRDTRIPAVYSGARYGLFRRSLRSIPACSNERRNTACPGARSADSHRGEGLGKEGVGSSLNFFFLRLEATERNGHNTRGCQDTWRSSCSFSTWAICMNSKTVTSS